MVRHPFLALLHVLCALPGLLPAQRANSLELGAVTGVPDAAVSIGFRTAPAAGRRASVDFAISTFPDVLAGGFLVALADVDVAYGARLAQDVLFFPRVGVSAMGGGGGGGAAGINVGLGFLGRLSSGLGLRLDYAHRWWLVTEINEPTWTSISVGIVWMRTSVGGG